MCLLKHVSIPMKISNFLCIIQGLRQIVPNNQQEETIKKKYYIKIEILNWNQLNIYYDNKNIKFKVKNNYKKKSYSKLGSVCEVSVHRGNEKRKEKSCWRRVTNKIKNESVRI